ncbi:hypothetical protein Lal_00036490 [Lupinus albus]|nr:hypothetical protein Lal_00036490 [Lupinus albus]
MVTTNNDQQFSSNSWYLNTGCSSHTRHKEWFTSLDNSMKIKVKFTDDKCVICAKIYKMRIKDRVLEIFNKKRNLIFKAPLSYNRTFKI